MPSITFDAADGSFYKGTIKAYAKDGLVNVKQTGEDSYTFYWDGPCWNDIVDMEQAKDDARVREFNTGRLYTTEGQIIQWWIEDDCVIFKDRSRMINGKIKLSDHDDGFDIPMEPDDAFVLRNYDAGNYENI